jgi:chromosome segregation ATPase
MNFDVRAFLRELALSGVYQRAFDLPSELLTLSVQAAEQSTKLEQERAAMQQRSSASTDAYTAAAEAWQEKEAALLPTAAELDTARNQYAEAKKKVEEAIKAVADATVQLQAKMGAAAPVQQAAVAAQAASKLLPEDKELSAAWQKIASRCDQLTAEVAAATQAVEEKTAAIAPTTQALGGLKVTIDAALTKVTLSEVAMKDAERNMLSARRKLSADTEALKALERKLETAKQSAKLAQLNQGLAAAKNAVTAHATEFAEAEKQLNEFAAVVTEHEAKVKSAADAMAAATKAVESARSEHATRSTAANAIAAALASATGARQKMSDDAALADVAAKLQRRADEARTQTNESQAQLEVASAGHTTADELFVAAQEALAAALAERARREATLEAAKQTLAAAQSDAAAKQSEFDTAVGELADRWSSDFTVASLKPLTPEQLCWTVFRVTGVYERYWQAEVAELDKTKPLTEEQKKDPAQVAARQIEIEQRAFDKLKGNEATFVSLYGAAAGQPQGDFFSTADQALFAANGGAINSWVAPSADNVTERIIKQEDLRVAAEELYLAVLTRMPKEDEAAEVITHLTNRKADKSAAAQELVWALLNSAEFRFNH